MQTPTPEPKAYAFALSTASFLLASKLARLETNEKRKDKKARVVKKKRDAIEEAFADILSKFESLKHSSLLEKRIVSWSKRDRALLLIDLAFGDPFSPYELNFAQKDFDSAYTAVAIEIGYEESQARSILATKKDALKAHHESHLWRIILTGGAVAVVFAVGGWIAAPVIAAGIGTAAGLSGAAATSYGLALLGGGSLAAGGMGMAGGLWIVTGVAAITGPVLVTSGQILYSMGFAQARLELIKLQVTYKEVLLQNQIETAKAKEVITKLYEDKREIEENLSKEKLLNESTSERVKDVEKKLKAIQTSIEWMNKQPPQL